MDMKKSTKQSIRTLSIITVVLGAILVALTWWNMGVSIWGHRSYGNVVWMEELKGWQITVIGGRLLTITLLFVLCCIFLSRILKGLDSGDIFPRSNIALLRWGALLMFFYGFFWNNIGSVLKGESQLEIDSNTILMPLIALVFAQLYKMAYLAAKDSSLAI